MIGLFGGRLIALCWSRAPGGRVTRWSVGVMRRLGVDGDLDVIVFMGPSGRQDKSKE